MKKQTTLSELLNAPVDLQKLIDALDFSEEDLFRANREQASLFLEASRYRVRRMRSRVRAESAFESAKTNAAMFLRTKKKLGPKGSFTEGYIRDKVSSHPDVIAAKEKFDDQEVYEEWAKLLLETYRYRGHAIRTLAELLGAEANAQARLVRKDAETAGFENLKNQVRKRFQGGGER